MQERFPSPFNFHIYFCFDFNEKWQKNEKNLTHFAFISFFRSTMKALSRINEEINFTDASWTSDRLYLNLKKTLYFIPRLENSTWFSCLSLLFLNCFGNQWRANECLGFCAATFYLNCLQLCCISLSLFPSCAMDVARNV